MWTCHNCGKLVDMKRTACDDCDAWRDEEYGAQHMQRYDVTIRAHYGERRVTVSFVEPAKVAAHV
jgi:hypothetical protein